MRQFFDDAGGVRAFDEVVPVIKTYGGLVASISGTGVNLAAGVAWMPTLGIEVRNADTTFVELSGRPDGTYYITLGPGGAPVSTDRAAGTLYSITKTSGVLGGLTLLARELFGSSSSLTGTGTAGQVGVFTSAHVIGGYSDFVRNGYGVGFGVSTPSARVHVTANSSSPNGAVMKYGAGGALLTVKERGAFEATDLYLYYSDQGVESVTRRRLAYIDEVGSGTVSEIDTGTGLTGGPITGSGTISLANTAVTPGAYGPSPQAGFTVDAQGRLTAAHASAYAASQVLYGAAGGGGSVEQSAGFVYTDSGHYLTITNGAAVMNLGAASTYGWIGTSSAHDVQILTGNAQRVTVLGSAARVGIGSVTAPTASLHLPAQTAAASSGPLKLTDTETVLATAEAGLFEFAGDLIFTSTGPSRRYVIRGPSGLAGLTTDGVAYATAQAQIATTAAGTSGQVFCGVTSGAPQWDSGPTLGAAATTTGYLHFGHASNVYYTTLSAAAGTTATVAHSLPTAGAPGDYYVLGNMSGTSADWAWKRIDLTTYVDGVLPIANGGTGSNPGVGNWVLTTIGSVTAWTALSAVSGVTGSGTTHGVAVWSSSSALTNVAVMGTGTYLRGVSGGNPIVSTLTLPNAGTTGDVFVATGTSTMGVVAMPAATGKMFRSASGAVPTWSTATFPDTATTAGAYLRADGTNWITSTLTLPNSATTGDMFVATGTNAMGSATGLFWDNTYARMGHGSSTKLSTLTVTPSADVTNIGGTTTANASTTITGSGTTFTTVLGIGDRISLSSASTTYATVTAIASDTSLTVSATLGNGSSQTINVKRSVARLTDSAGATRFLLNDQGFVTVGTATPLTTGNAGNPNATMTLLAASVGDGVYLQAGTATATPEVRFYNSSGTALARFGAAITANDFFTGSSAGDVVMQNSVANKDVVLVTNATVAMRVLGTNQNIGIGISPAQRLHVYSGSTFSGKFDALSTDTTNLYAGTLLLNNASATSNNFGGISYTNQADQVVACSTVKFVNHLTGTSAIGHLLWATRLSGDGAPVQRMILQNGLQIGSPTGGDKGAGTLNTAADQYKNGTAFTNPKWALKHFWTGDADREGPYAMAHGYKGLLTLEATEAYTRQHHELPTMDLDKGGGIFARGDLVLASVEECYLHMFQLNERIKKLEGRPQCS